MKERPPRSHSSKKKTFPEKQKSSKKVGFEEVGTWYDQCVQDEGHLYHRELIFPKLKTILSQSKTLFDFGCGQGVAFRVLDQVSTYIGVDSSATLLKEAKNRARGQKVGSSRKSVWIQQDLCDTRLIPKGDESTAANGNKDIVNAVSDLQAQAALEEVDLLFLLSLQNMSSLLPPLSLAGSIARKAKKSRLHLVLNHPCFRIPRQSHWGYDESKKLQYRRIDRYNSPLEIPITVGFNDNGQTAASSMSYHSSLADIFHALAQAGFSTTRLEEWSSHKLSSGARAKAENRARREIPLFLYIEAELLSARR